MKLLNNIIGDLSYLYGKAKDKIRIKIARLTFNPISEPYLRKTYKPNHNIMKTIGIISLIIIIFMGGYTFKLPETKEVKQIQVPK